jgi:hypothetical protein
MDSGGFMTDVQQVKDDLQFVRQAVDRRPPVGRDHALRYYWWAAYVLIGYFLLDINPVWGSWFLMIAGLVVMAVIGMHAKRRGQIIGEIDRVQNRRNMLHWAGGIFAAVFFPNLLAGVVPALRGPVCGQIEVLMIGMVYFMWGVHVDKTFLWLGPIMMLGGALVGFVPHYPWTWLGALIAVGLVVAGILVQRKLARDLAVQPQ